MKLLIQLFCLLGSTLPIEAQNLEMEMMFPDTLKSTNNKLTIHSPKWEKEMKLTFSKGDTIDWGTYGYKGVSFTVSTDLDTLNIPHVNHPYRQLIRIPLASLSDTTILVLRFQPTINSNISEAYKIKNKGKISFEIPEVYELANIILFLSECSRLTSNHPDSEYANDVEQYFLPYKDHPLIKTLNKNCRTNQWSTYYGFRENSICFKFEEDYLQYNTPFKHVYSDKSEIMGGQFRNMLYLVQDFVDKSNFRKFYQNNLSYFAKLIDRQNQLLPINEMWKWLEGEFPQRMDSYKIIFSPLIEGSHSTQKFIKGFFVEPDFQECLMFMNSPEHIDFKKEYAEDLKVGIMSGVVFTEIDHNYVNPTSSENIDHIKELINNKDFWATKEAQQNYSSEYAIFNEYMTHSLFCLFAMEKYDKKIEEEIIERRINLMERRGFPKFNEFNTKLIRLMKNRKRTIYDAYSDLLESMKSIE